MIHPKTELKFISEEIGYGVVATEFIPKGTITWVFDKLDREISPLEFESIDPIQRDILETHLFRNSKGNFVLCWDIGRYINHSFKSNCFSTAYNFEIAIQDIYPGEQLTNDYGFLNIVEPFRAFDEGTKRKIVYPDDLLRYSNVWDKKMATVFGEIVKQEQPLRKIISDDIWNEIILVSNKEKEMISIRNNYYQSEAIITSNN